jgi:TrmH family RNA methyltransferase
MALSKARIKYIRSLQLHKYRQKYGKFLIEGDKMARETLAQHTLRVDQVYALPNWIETLPPAWRAGRDIEAVTEAELQKISGLSSPNQALLVAGIPQPRFDPGAPARDYCLYLDGIRDPGNYGAILRVADWFGIPAVFSAPDSVDPYHPKAIAASMGAFLRVRAMEIALESILAAAPGIPVLGAEREGDNVFQCPLPGRGLLVIGGEGQGISPSAAARLNARVGIPAPRRAGAESLNAAVAAGILCAVLRNR